MTGCGKVIYEIDFHLMNGLGSTSVTIDQLGQVQSTRNNLFLIIGSKERNRSRDERSVNVRCTL